MRDKSGSKYGDTLSRVSSTKHKWMRLPFARKAELLVEMLQIFATLDHEAWARESLKAQGYERVVPETSVAVEMILNTRSIATDLESLVDVMCTLRDTNRPPAVPIRQGGQGEGSARIARVFPRTMPESRGPDSDWTVDVWMDGEQAGSQGLPPRNVGRLGLLLAAGNQGILAFADALHMLFMENMTVVVKHNPVRDYNHKWMERVFAPLIAQGYFASVQGGVDVSKSLIADERVDHIHMTGGKNTHDLIVWGHPSRRDHKRLQKPITSELGTIAPYVIGPGDWTDAELSHHAKYFATVVMNNNGCNCMAPQVLLLPDTGFPTGRFLAIFKQIVKARPHAPPYYPGTKARYDAWVEAVQAVPEARTEFIESDVKLPPGRFGPPLPWAFSTIPFEVLASGRLETVTQVEAFGPTLAITTVPGAQAGGSFWSDVTRFCNDVLFGSLAATVVMHPSRADEGIVAGLRYGSVGVNSWGGQSYRFNGGSWGAFPGEPLEAVESGIGVVRNFLLFQGVQKTVVRAPFVSGAHIGTSATPPNLKTARWLCGLLSNGLSTARHNIPNSPSDYIKGNFRPIEGEGVYADLPVEGQIPPELRGCYIRNGTNQKYSPTGKMHMFDGDSMLHAFILEDGKCKSYANSYVRTPRHVANESKGRDLWPTFGDLTVKPGLESAKKFGWVALQQRAGALPPIKTTRAQNPSTSTALIAGKFYACVEVNSPFRIYLDPATGKVSSGSHEDFDGKVLVFSAHSKVDAASGDIIFFAKGPRSPNASQTATNVFGVIDSSGQVTQHVEFRCGPGAPPAFLHDYFVTRDWAICIDHSLRADPSKMVSTGYFDWDPKRNLRLGLLPRAAHTGRDGVAPEVEWYDLGMPGFVWHVVGASQDGDRVTCWMPVFEDDYSDLPIHLACEPHSFLFKVVINTATKTVEELRKFDELGPTERCSINDNHVGAAEPRYGYLMMRGPDEMYEGFAKFDLHKEEVVAFVPYGPGRLGGEALFQPREGATSEDDGWLFDIIYDKNTDSSELCIWDARQLDSPEPIAVIKAPHRIPYGVHASFLTPQELQRQWEGH